LSAFLRHVVEETLAGKAADLKERNIAADVYGKGADFDASVDPVVRVDARRMRDKLREYYAANPARDIVISLPKGSYSPTFEGPRVAGPRIDRQSRIWWYGAALIATVVSAFGLAGIGRWAPAGAPVIRVLLRPPPEVQLADLRTTGPPLVSPDGGSVAFVGTAAGKPRVIWIQKLDAAEASALPNTEDASYPFWSPDGSHLGFFAQGKLRTIEVTSRTVQTLCDSPGGRGGGWSARGVLLFSPRPKSPLFRVASSGGPVAAVTSAEAGESHMHPSFLPDGERFIYNVGTAGHQFELRLGSLTTPSLQRDLFILNSHAVYASGHLLFVRESVLTAVPFDAKTGQVNGEARAIASGVAAALERPSGDFSVSANGVLLYRQAVNTSPALAWHDRRGSVRSATPARSDRDASLSPSGRFLSTVEFDEPRRSVDLWLHDFERGTRARITSGEGTEYTPAWSHDDRTVYFTTHELPQFYLYRQDVLAGGSASRLTERSDWFAVTDVSPDGAFLLLQTRTPRGDHDLLRFNTASQAAEPLVQTRFSEAQARMSPDGRWLAYVSDETGRYEVYVSSRDKIAARIPVSQTGGVQPRWSRNGRTLFFISLDGDLMAVAPPWETSTAVRLFATGIDARSRDAVEFTQYAVSADGERFLMRSVSQKQIAPSWMLVGNWPAAARGSRR
jgi:Tol biopolymer transport system component